MTAPTLTYSWDGYVKTPCLPWCSDICDGTSHGSDPVDINVKCHVHPLTINVVQPTTEAEPKITLIDGHEHRVDEFTATEAEHLANLLLDHAKIIRGAGR